MGELTTTPFDHEREIGSVIQVTPLYVKVNLPYAADSSSKLVNGFKVPYGEVGEFVFIQSDSVALFGRISEIKLPESERLSVEAESSAGAFCHPVGYIKLLNAIDLIENCVCNGIPTYPRLGAKVFSAKPQITSWMINSDDKGKAAIELGCLCGDRSNRVRFHPSDLIGRHCAILGTTGGGKSCTLAKLLQQVDLIGGKAILIDPSGEFENLGPDSMHVSMGGGVDGCEEVTFPYQHLVEKDLFAIFQPSGASQTPKLKEAIKSLKLVRLSPEIGESGLLIKENQDKEPIFKYFTKFASELAKPEADFDISFLARQIENECIFPSRNYGKDPSCWGDKSQQDYSYCVSLITRIESFISDDSLACLFAPSDNSSVIDTLANFMKSNKKILRINLEMLSFTNSIREIIANAIGRYLMSIARTGFFHQMPTVVCLDEAHQFLNKNIGDESHRVYLDAFGLIAKEGRKYSLTSLISTQRPRDIPEDVLSQMGTMIVHRLINQRDQEVVERSCGELDKSVSAFLPTLSQGEAIIVGTGIPIPLPLQIDFPERPPVSKGADYDKFWGG